MRRINVPSQRNLQPAHSQTPWRGPVGYQQGNTSVLIPQSSCQGSPFTEVFQDVTEHLCTILLLGIDWSLVRKTPGSVPEEVASPAPSSTQDWGAWEPHPWSLGWQQWGLWGPQARPGSVGVCQEPSCPCSALCQEPRNRLAKQTALSSLMASV